MRPLPLTVQTLYADLAQGATFSSVHPGSVFAQTRGGKKYLYATTKQGATRVQDYLGPADDPAVRRRADAIRRAAQDARLRRRTVSILKRLGVPAPSLYLGRLLETIAKAGLFRNGIVLVGTAAYQLYSPLVGAALALGAMRTEDADLAAASLAVASEVEGESLLNILQRADATFAPQLGLDPRVPARRFRSSAGFDVDVITRVRKRADEERPVRIPGLQCSAQALRHLEYLLEEPVAVVALYGSGVQVTVPQPARYAVHKLIVAQQRDTASAKRAKDIAQARELIEVLRANDPHSLADAFEDARGRGTRWRTRIARSLREIGIE